MGKFYITGDTHGDFRHLYFYQARYNLFTEDDVLIILGDSGFNYYVDENPKWKESPLNHRKYIPTTRSQRMKRDFLANCPATIFCIHGNHEARAETVEGYQTKQWNGSPVYYEPEFPRLLFAKDGSLYHFSGHSYLIIGGAYSVDKANRLLGFGNWFEDEQPSEEIKARIEKLLEENHWKVHGVLSHTCPFHYEPRELFLSGINQASVDASTEKCLDTIEQKLDYSIWYFGHFHGNKKIDKMVMLFNDIEELK